MGKKAGEMYALRPVLDLDTPVPLPSCMYPMPRLLSPRIPTTENEKVVNGVPDKELATLQCQQDAIIDKLNSLKKQIESLRSDLTDESKTQSSAKPCPASKPVCLPSSGLIDIVVSVPPSQPPYSLLLMTHLLKEHPIASKCHVHSSIETGSVSPSLLNFLNNGVHDRSSARIAFTLVWKKVSELEFMVDPMQHTRISGEVNLCRYLARMIPSLGYETGDPKKDTICDTVLDAVSKTLEGGGGKEKQATLRMLDSRLGAAPYIMGKDLSVVDLYVWSVLHRGDSKHLPAHLSKWYTGICTGFRVN